MFSNDQSFPEIEEKRRKLDKTFSKLDKKVMLRDMKYQSTAGKTESKRGIGSSIK